MNYGIKQQSQYQRDIRGKDQKPTGITTSTGSLFASESEVEGNQNSTGFRTSHETRDDLIGWGLPDKSNHFKYFEFSKK
jgi:hypothetical protein